jgi:hypothetical protein
VAHLAIAVHASAVAVLAEHLALVVAGHRVLAQAVHALAVVARVAGHLVTVAHASAVVALVGHQGLAVAHQATVAHALAVVALVVHRGLAVVAHPHLVGVVQPHPQVQAQPLQSSPMIKKMIRKTTKKMIKVAQSQISLVVLVAVVVMIRKMPSLPIKKTINPKMPMPIKKVVQAGF